MVVSPILQPIVGTPKEGPSLAGYHKIVDYLRCPQEYKYHHVLGIEQKDKEEKKALAVGVLCHHGRATWFGSQFKCTIEQAQEAITDYVRDKPSPTNKEAEREALRLTAAYIEHWRSKPLPLCRAVEYDISPTPVTVGDDPSKWRTARFDDLSHYQDNLGQLCIGDLKTTSDSISGCVNEYRQHGQFIMYNILYKNAGKETIELFGPAHGIMLDIMTKDAVPKFHREVIHITPFQEHWYKASMNKWISEANAITPTTWTPRNVTMCARAISRKGSYGCDYRELCQRGNNAASKYVLRSNGETPTKEMIEL